MMFRKERGKLVPDQPYDAELLDAYPDGALFESKDRSRRSNPQNSFYWVALGRVVEATGKWASSQQLHRQLLISCGHHTSVVTLDGGIRLEADSAAFSNMKHHAFTNYLKHAWPVLSETTGIDLEAMMREPA